MQHCFPERARRTLVMLVMLVAVLALAAAAAGAAAAKQTGYAATIKEGRTAAQTLLEQSGAASLSLVLMRGDRVVWQEAFGVADTATSAPPSADTMYGIGSVSKMLAAVAAMRLVDQGKVDLDAPLTRYLPGLLMSSAAYRQITVRMLLDHSSGLPGSSYGNISTGVFFPGYLQQVLDTLASERLKTTPGYMSVYCNDGFTLIEALVASVAGKTYAQFVEDEVFKPLGMEHSEFPLTTFADGTYAKVYAGGKARPFEVLNTLASGGAYSTPTDLGRLGAMLMDGGMYKGTRVLSAASVAEMGSDQTTGSFDPAPSEALAYGLGWDTVTEPGLKAVGVTGWLKGGDSIDYHAAFTVAPKARLAVAVTGVTPLASSALATLGQSILLRALVEQKTLRRLPAPLPAAPPPVKAASAAQLSAMTGYWGKFDQVVHIKPSADDPQALDIEDLTWSGWAPSLTGLRLRTDGRFHADGSTMGLSTLNAGGRQYIVLSLVGGTGHYREQLLYLQRLAAEEPLSAAWQARTGKLWLAVSDQPDSSAYSIDGRAVFGLSDVPGLPGYVVNNSFQPVLPVDDTVGSMFLQLPGMESRDLEDVEVESRGGEEWLRWGNVLYRPQATVPALAAGANAVTFGAEGYGEWRSLASAGTVQIGAGAATTWYLYDRHHAVLGSGTTFPATVTAPGPDGHLLLFGTPGSSATVTVTPAGAASPAAPADSQVPRQQAFLR